MVEDYLKFAGEKTPTQSSRDGSGDSSSTVTHSVSSPCIATIPINSKTKAKTC